MNQEQLFAVYEAFLKANPHVTPGEEIAQRIVDRFNASQPLAFTVETLTKIAGEIIAEDNKAAAERFVTPLTAGQLRATVAAHPELTTAIEGTLTKPLDLTKIRIVTPDNIERFAGVDAEKGLHRTQEKRRQSWFVSDVLGRKS